MLDKLIESVTQQVAEVMEQMMLTDIIDIYNGAYKNYDEYYRAVLDYNSKCQKHNEPKYGQNICGYTMSYMPEKRLLLKNNFDFIRSLALKKK